MFDLYIFAPEVVRGVPLSILSRYSVVYSTLFKAMISFRTGIEYSPVAGFAVRKITFGDLIDFDFSRDLKKLAKDPSILGEVPVDWRTKVGAVPAELR